MLYRPVDENGDMMPVYTASQMLSGARAVRQAADARIGLIEGEWWEDPSLGFRMYATLIRSARSGEAQMLENYISSYIAQTQECVGVTRVKSSLKNRAMTYECTVLAEDGSSAALGVTEDALFSSIH